MSNIWTLIKVFLKTGFSNGAGSKKKKLASHPLLWSIVVVILVMASLGAPEIALVNKSYDILSQVGLQNAIVSLILVTSCIITFIFGVVYVIGTFYFSSDVGYLLPLPLQPYEIVGAKFVTVLVYEYLTELMFILLPLGAYGVKSEAGLMYWIGLVIIFLVLPIVPLVAAAIINMVIMSFTNLGKHKDALRILGGTFAIVLSLGVNLAINSSAKNAASKDMIMNIANGDNAIINLITRMFPTSKFATLTLVGEGSKGILNLIIFLTITIAALGIFYFVANALYFKGALGGSETFSKRKKLSSEEIGSASKENTIFFSYLIKEVKMLLRTPAYLVNCVLPAIIMPVFMVVIMFMSGGKNGDLNQIRNVINNPTAMSIAIVVVTCSSIFLGSSNVISGTALSREGKNFVFMKYIPVSLLTQVMAKVTVGVVLGEIGVLVVLVMCGFLGFSPLFILAVIPLTLLGVIFSNLTAVIIDLTGPKLDWENEQLAVKQNFRAVISTFLNLAIAGGLAFLSYLLKLSYIAQYALLAAILVLASVLLFFYINNRVVKWMNKIS